MVKAPSAKPLKIAPAKVVSCDPPSYFFLHAKRLSMSQSVCYDSDKLRSTAYLDLFMTPKPNCASAYAPLLMIKVHNEKKNFWGNWKDDARTTTISHGYSKNYNNILSHTNASYPTFSQEWGGLTLNETMSTIGTAFNVYYIQAFQELNSNDYNDIFRLVDYWAHITIYGGPSGASIDFGPFM